MSVIRVVRKFRGILSKHQKFRIFELVVCMIFGGFLEMCSVSLMIPFIDIAMNPEKAMENLYVSGLCTVLHISSPRIFLAAAAVFIAFLYVFKNVYLLLEYSIQYRFVYGNMLEMQQKILKNFLERPYEFFLKINSGEVVRIIHNDTSGAFGLLTTLLALFTELTVSGMLVIAVLVIAPAVTVIMSAVFLTLVLVIHRRLKPVLGKAGKANQVSLAAMNQWLMQSIQGIKEIKVMSKEQFFQDNYILNGKKFIDAERKSKMLTLAPRFYIEAVSMGLAFLAVAFLILNGYDLEKMLPVLSAVAMAAVRLLPSVNRISASLTAVSYHEPMLDKMIESLKDMSGNESVRETEYGNKKLPVFRKSIELDKISYKYPDTEKNVLDSACLKIRKGESIGIIGASGAGKTTAVDILLGLLYPQDGMVMMDGVNIKESICDWHKKIGYIPQTIFMLDASIRSNVAFGVSENEISEDDVWRALQDAALEDFVKSLPDGLDTEIGERGVRLSGGQRQRIGIARALYADPEILVFDEATSALDYDTEANIMESIHLLQGEKTMIIIAHRLTTIQSCSHIYQVEDGRIERIK